jgi:hypothetical protein
MLESTKNTFIQIIDDPKTTKDMKLFCIMCLLHEEKFGFSHALEECTKHGILSDHWAIIDYDIARYGEK